MRVLSKLSSRQIQKYKVKYNLRFKIKQNKVGVAKAEVKSIE